MPHDQLLDLNSGWDSLPFSLEEYAHRIAVVKQAMRKQNVDALVVTAPDNIYYLTGYDSLGYYQFQAIVLEVGRDEPWASLPRGRARFCACVHMDDRPRVLEARSSRRRNR